MQQKLPPRLSALPAPAARAKRSALGRWLQVRLTTAPCGCSKKGKLWNVGDVYEVISQTEKTLRCVGPISAFTLDKTLEGKQWQWSGHLRLWKDRLTKQSRAVRRSDEEDGEVLTADILPCDNIYAVQPSDEEKVDAATAPDNRGDADVVALDVKTNGTAELHKHIDEEPGSRPASPSSMGDLNTCVGRRVRMLSTTKIWSAGDVFTIAKLSGSKRSFSILDSIFVGCQLQLQGRLWEWADSNPEPRFASHGQ